LSRITGRGALAAAIALGLLLQAHSLTVFFHQDDFAAHAQNASQSRS